jgi:hypothetical protein
VRGHHLALSEAAFATGATQVQQIVFEKRRGTDRRRQSSASSATLRAPGEECTLPPQPFPRAALDANRSGRLTPDQSTFYRGEAASDRKNLLIGGLIVAGLGAVVVFGALTGRAPGGRLESFLVGAALLAVGAVVAFFGGIRGSQAKSAAVDAGRVTPLEGPFRRERRDRRDGSFGDDSSHISPGNEYEYYLLVGDRSFSVPQEQWEAAPEDGVVRVYLLGDSDRIVNLERIADAPPPQVPGFVRAAVELAAKSPDPDRAAEARALLRQADALTGVAAVTTTPGGAAAATTGAPSGAPAVPLEQAILGTWRSDLAGITYEFRADGSAAASSARHGAREQRWSLAGLGTIHLDGATFQAAVDGDALPLGEPPRFLTFHRVG